MNSYRRIALLGLAMGVAFLAAETRARGGASPSALTPASPGSATHETGASLPTLGVIPDFSLYSASGGTVTREYFTGKVTLVSFFFSSCHGPCPLLMQQMKRLGDELSSIPELRLLSISIDPSHDSSEALREYGDTLGVNPGVWTLASGPIEPIVALARDGFHLAVDPGVTPPIHSVSISLVDRAGQLRGSYTSTDPDKIARLRSDVRALAADGH